MQLLNWNVTFPLLLILQLSSNMQACLSQTVAADRVTDKSATQVRGISGVLLADAANRTPLKVLANGEGHHLCDSDGREKLPFKSGIPYYVFEDLGEWYLVSRTVDSDVARRDGLHARKRECLAWHSRYAVWPKEGSEFNRTLAKVNGGVEFSGESTAKQTIPWPVLRVDLNSSAWVVAPNVSLNGIAIETIRISRDTQSGFDQYVVVSEREVDTSLTNAIALLGIFDSGKPNSVGDVTRILGSFLTSEPLLDVTSVHALDAKLKLESQRSGNVLRDPRVNEELKVVRVQLAAQCDRLKRLASNRQFYNESIRHYVFPTSAWQLEGSQERSSENDKPLQVEQPGIDLAEKARKATLLFLGGSTDAGTETASLSTPHDDTSKLKGEQIQCMTDGNGLPRKVVVVSGLGSAVDVAAKKRPGSKTVSQANLFDVLYVYAEKRNYYRVAKDPYAGKGTGWLPKAACIEFTDDWLILVKGNQVGPVERMHLWQSEEAAREGDPAKAIVEEYANASSRTGLLLPVIEKSRDGRLYRVALPLSVALPIAPDFRPSDTEHHEAGLTWSDPKRQFALANATFQYASLDESLKGHKCVLGWIRPDSRFGVYARMSRHRAASAVASIRRSLEEARAGTDLAEDARTATYKYFGLEVPEGLVKNGPKQSSMPPIAGAVKNSKESAQSLNERHEQIETYLQDLNRLNRYCENPTFAKDGYLWVPLSLFP